MKRTLAAMTLVALLSLVPVSQAQDPAQALASLEFKEVLATVDAGVVHVYAQEGAISGQNAIDLRGCIDNSNCPDPAISNMGRGDGNGEVDDFEVRAFQGGLTLALNLAAAGPGADLRESASGLVKIDGRSASQSEVKSIEFHDAVGDAGSNAPIHVYVRVDITFNGVESARKHTITISRARTDLEFAKRIVIKPAEGWKIPVDSIQPADMRGIYDGTGLSGTQSQFQGTQPFTFQIQKTGAPAWVWWLLGALVLAAAGAFFWWWKRRDRPAPQAAPVTAPAPAPAPPPAPAAPVSTPRAPPRPRGR